jgi:2-octaprenyl-6-methoxyphenol hydroxylase
MATSEIDRTHDAAIVGAGPAGLVTALALAHVGADVVLVGPAPPKPSPHPLDTRTAALLESSVEFLKKLKVWDGLVAEAAPLKAVRIIDASQSLFRAPEIEFKASELGLDAFGYNIPNMTLVKALYARAQQDLRTVFSASVCKIALNGVKAVLELSENEKLAARLVVGGDGRSSMCRKFAGIEVTEWRYEQGAIATSFRHALPHEGVSTELHQEAGSLTTVPLPDAHASSLIWVGRTPDIAGLMQRDEESFAAALEDRLGGILGRVSAIGARAEFPVARLTAKTLARARTALVGEAAHLLPPIGAQGLNLGFRDAAALADCVADALRRESDPGGSATLSAYERSRQVDVVTRSVGIDLLNRSLLTNFPPLQAARGIVLHGLNALPPLRRLVMRLGLEPPTKLPTLMKGSTG